MSEHEPAPGPYISSERNANGFGQFLRAMGEYTVPTHEENRSLIEAAQQGDQAARNELIERHLRLVVDVAKQLRWSELPLEDLVQEGVFGLAHAIDKFDLGRGVKFSTYATDWVRQSIQRAIENTGRTIRIPTHLHTTWQKLRKISLATELLSNRPPTEEELLRALEVMEPESPEEKSARSPRERAKQSLAAVQRAFSLATVAIEHKTDEGDELMLELPIPPDHEPFEDEVIERLDREQLRVVRERLCELPPVKQTVVEFRHNFDGEADGDREFGQVGKILGMSKQGAQQHYKPAIRQLREQDDGTLAALAAVS